MNIGYLFSYTAIFFITLYFPSFSFPISTSSFLSRFLLNFQFPFPFQFLPSSFTPRLQPNPLDDAPYPIIHHPIADDPEDLSPEPQVNHHSFDYPMIRGSLRLIIHNSTNNPIGDLSIGSNVITELCWKRGDEWLSALNLTTREALNVWLNRILGHLNRTYGSGDWFSPDPRFTVTMLIPSLYFHRLFPPGTCLKSHFRQGPFYCETSNERPPESDFGEHRLPLTGNRFGLFNSIYYTHLKLMELEGYTDGQEFILYD